jgi:hypothetical protein
MLAFAIKSLEMDFKTLLEASERPPVAFENRKGLEDWMASNSLSDERIGKRRLHNICLVVGQVSTPLGPRLYSQVWAKATYRTYRYAYLAHVLQTFGSNLDLSAHDIDHAVSKAHVAEFWPEAWVNLLLVERSLNRAIGPMLERNLRAPVGTSISFGLEPALKLFYQRMMRLKRSQAESYLAQTSQHFITSRDTLRDRVYADNVISILAEIADEIEE